MLIIGTDASECERYGCSNEPLGKSRFCSPACRAADWRDSKRATLRQEVDCELCGTPFFPRYGNQRVCDYNSRQAGADCRSLQDDLMEAQEETQEERMSAVCEREGCEVLVYRPGRGRPKRFCSPRCKTAHYRSEKRSV